MPSPTYRQVILEAAIDGSVIRGMLTVPTGESRDFHGWLELNTALEAILNHAPDQPRPELPNPSGLGVTEPAARTSPRHAKRGES